MISSGSLPRSYQMLSEGDSFKVTIKLILHLFESLILWNSWTYVWMLPNLNSMEINIFDQWFMFRCWLLRIPGISKHFNRQEFDHHLPHNYIRSAISLTWIKIDGLTEKNAVYKIMQKSFYSFLVFHICAIIFIN